MNPQRRLVGRALAIFAATFLLLPLRSSAQDLAPQPPAGTAGPPPASSSTSSSKSAPAAEPAPASGPTVEDQLLQHLPEDWRDIARHYHVFTERDASLLKIQPASEIDGAAESEALQALLDDAGAEEFVAGHLDDVLATTRTRGPQESEDRAGESMGRYLYAVAYDANWLNSPLATPLLEREAAVEPNAEISLAAVNALHILEANRARAVVDRRLFYLSDSDYNANRDQIDQLEQEQQDLLYIRDQIDLPEFMRKAPPVFNVHTKANSIRVAMMGDFGTRGEDQHRVAAAMVEEHRKKPFDFGITLGDNFYVDLKSWDDPNFKLAFEDLYGPMNITFYPCFGNHDWGGEYPALELSYSKKNPHWDFPAPYYTYTAGPVQFFVINSEYEGAWPSVPAIQLRWLQQQLDASKARWKVVYSHMPIYTTDYGVPDMISALLPVLKGRADLYICGHVHNLEQHKPVDGVNLFVIGASGRGEVPVHDDPDTVWAKEAYGFGVLEANDHDLTIHIIGEDDKEMHSATFHK